MLKYSDYDITCSEVPDEISLTFSVTNCGARCKGCHSPWLQEDIGLPLFPAVKRLTETYKSLISCVCFLGEGQDTEEMVTILKWLNDNYPHLKLALYSGKNSIPQSIMEYLNYYKVGAYVEELGALDSPLTNQRFYSREGSKDILLNHKFRRSHNDQNSNDRG
jgi:anaerobic ribonucleoside-triphosphate reductase activating protein